MYVYKNIVLNMCSALFIDEYAYALDETCS